MKEILDKLEKTLNLTKPEDDGEKDEYILTQEEENLVIEHELGRVKQFKAWRLKKMGVSEMEILSRISQIDWEKEIDRDDILKKANANKNYELWQKKQREIEKKELEEKKIELKKTWTASNILRHMRWYSQHKYFKPLIEDQQTISMLKTICFFLSEDERFETELNLNLKKGLWIRGSAGLGKTYTVTCASTNPLSPIHIHSMIEIAKSVKEDGEYPIADLTGKLYLDDVGSEEAIVNHYGTKINWFKDFIENFYLRSSQFNKLIVSTNKNFDTTESKYGFRVRSRTKDMFNVIDITGKDMRG